MEAILIQDEKYLVIYKLERSLFVVNLGILTVCILYCPKRIAKIALDIVGPREILHNKLYVK